MTDTEILTKAIEKAVKNGFSGFGHKDASLIWDEKTESYWYHWKTTDEEGEPYIAKSPFCPNNFELIFSHSFAKAFWGTDQWWYGWIKRVNDEATDFPTGWQWFPDSERNLNTLETEIKTGLEAWQYHLQVMVLEENPISYIGRFL